ncbi:PREDICTED: increased DNA methylation 1 [Prunus dulcis]|uniref:PREDICTED: increased DNA methylation 1 n=1 Tax=Prunus dulcis TaxID=3755 RepID=A0A5E4ERT9_PRUDU|nr:uncharacterized protein LOC117633252 isoform X1 [Prunus dulcis]VVA16558.1 PREDICTED: increased DNA methylation 1 [Prunus dulcis]
MAGKDLEELGSLRKRKRRTQNKKKLLVGDKVEVRSLEDGFQGSWHPGIVTACKKQGCRQVQYDHILYDDWSGNLVDVVSVSPILDGIGSFTLDWSNYRGCIRPTPPRIQPGEWDLPYGLCVDVYHLEAWWEGVIFDHEDGSEERRIFFPDLGDELKARIDTLRITHDWDEVTENWKRRGTWILLELLEQYNQERYIAVSVKQIWYDVREKEPFEWTSLMRHVWEELVLEVINDNISITVDELFGALDKSGFFSQETQVELESAVFVSDANMNPKENMADSLAIVPVDELLNSDLVVDREDAVNKALNCSAEIIDERHLNGGLSINPDSACTEQVQEKSYWDQLISVVGDEGPNMNSLEYSDISFQTKGVCVLPQVLLVFPPNLDGNSCTNSVISNDGICSTNYRGRSTLDWRPLDTPAEFCPDAVDEYADFVKGMSSKFSTTVVKQHISYLGWKIHSAMDKGRPRLRYLSPAGEYEYSLRQVCKNLKKRKKDTLFSISQDAHQDLHGSAEESLLIEQPQEIQHPNYYPQKVESPCSKVFIFKPEYCPEAVVEYYMHAAGKTIKKELRKMISKAKKHLSAVGWVFVYLNAKSRNFHYRSPSGVLYRTLKSACKSCMDEGVSEKRPAECMYVVEEDEGQLTRNKLCSAASNLDFQEGLVPLKRLSKKWSRDSGNVKVQGRRKRQRKRNDTLSDLAPDLLQRQPYLHGRADGSTKDQCTSPPKLKRRKVSGGLNRLKNGLDGSPPTRVLRSSKWVQEAVTSTSSHNNPRTVLSWLIDNNVVLPRAKVHHRSTKDSHPMKEGRITREGIRCTCCQEVYALSCFGNHAGSSYCSPSANIFLEDGRSLLDCQMQIMHDRRKRSLRKEPRDRIKGNWRRGENDYICTVCHYGGDLILCDQCPSSFHKSCLGLKYVPDGDWFCASCCCGICGQTNFKEDKEPIMDDSSVLTCGQCEHKYHKGCLRKRGADKLESDPKGNWFCTRNCKKIFLGLHELLGKQIPVGDNNLSWSLVKSIKSDIHDTDEPHIDAIESYSRLNVALDVMHECFVPVKEPLTRRDLVEDIIFTRGSDLNRLNFRGFYTVLLERNDELITVATVRIFGGKVAEVPLVATRFQYRRLGMCRILMDELEKMLMQLGVERLVLPAVPSVLNTWTTSFGFSTMTASERLQFLDYTFLDFQGTIMCQKQLMKNPPNEAVPLEGTQLDLCLDTYESHDNIDVDRSSAVSEVYQAEQIEDSGIVHQGVDRSSPEFSSMENAIKKRARDGDYKQYKRRRISANGS